MTKKNPVITTLTHHSNILKSIKASLAPAPVLQRNFARTPSTHGKSPSIVHRMSPLPLLPPPPPVPPPASIMLRSMTKGHGKAVRPAVDQIKWLSGVSVMHRREGSGDRSDGSATHSCSRARSKSVHVTSSRAGVNSAGTESSDEGYPATLKEE